MARPEDGTEEERRTAVLVVDDDGDVRVALEMLLSYEGFEVWTAKDGDEALKRIAQEAARGRRPGVVLSDLKMPRMDGIELLEKLRGTPGAPPVVMISGHGDIASAVEAVQKGAANFLEKPLDEGRVLVTLRAALREERLATENRGLRRKLAEGWELVAESAPMRALAERVEQAARSDAAVLITGENGTGKEVVARVLHLSGRRAAGPFVAVNCAAIPHELIESELFGHEKGSFTGAFERRIGHFEAADGGTLFLDEIGDMPLAAQAKVLRALETHEITRVGDQKPIRVDIRVLAATNADLAQAVEAKSFRPDLYYRLDVVPLRVPPLRERREDVGPLARHFLARIAAREGRSPLALEPEALAWLASLEWPGNVRQLRNALEAASVFAEGTVLRKGDLEAILEAGPALATPDTPASAEADPFACETFEEFKAESEKLFIRRKLAENGGNITRTAERLGMQRSHIYKKLDRYGLR